MALLWLPMHQMVPSTFFTHIALPSTALKVGEIMICSTPRRLVSTKLEPQADWNTRPAHISAPSLAV